MHINQFAIVEKSLAEEVTELSSLGFEGFRQPADRSPKDLFVLLLEAAPVDATEFLATADSDFLDFVGSDAPLSWEIFYCLGLQLLNFHAVYDFAIGQATDFAGQTGLPVADTTAPMTVEALTHAVYLLLCSRGKLGMTLVERWVAGGLLPLDNVRHVFNDKTLATFDMTHLIKEVVYVETAVDTLGAGMYDLVKVQIWRPDVREPLPVVMTASPYHMGTNDVAADKRTHDMAGSLTQKTPVSARDVKRQLPTEPDYELTDVTLATGNRATETFTHGWTSSLNNYLLARGFASVYVAGVGTRGSDGMQTSGDYQQIAAMKAVIDWLGGRARAFTGRRRTRQIKADWATGKVATTGKSYLGTMSYGLATTGVEGLEVILAEAGISSWYHYYREGGLVRSPGGFPGEDLDVLAELTYSRDLAGADYLRGHAAYQERLSQLTEDLSRDTGDYNAFWAARDYLPDAVKTRCDVLIEHGLQDWNVTPDQAYNFWQALPRRISKHAILHRGAHIYANAWQSLDYSEIINAYFTAKLLGRPLSLDLPPIILQENGRDEHWRAVERWGATESTTLSLGHGIATFENSYSAANFEHYSKDYKAFKKALYQGQLAVHTAMLDLPIAQSLMINGVPRLQLRLKLTDTKGLLSVQLLDFGNKKRLSDSAQLLEAGVLDRGQNFKEESLSELPLTDSPYQLISKGFLNLQNRDGLLTTRDITADSWFDLSIPLQPQLYQLQQGDTLRLLIYSTDFEHTLRDNRACRYTLDLAQSGLTLPTEN